MRRLVVRDGSSYLILPNARPLLQYDANSIRHLLPEEDRWVIAVAISRIRRETGYRPPTVATPRPRGLLARSGLGPRVHRG